MGITKAVCGRPGRHASGVLVVPLLVTACATPQAPGQKFPRDFPLPRAHSIPSPRKTLAISGEQTPGGESSSPDVQGYKVPGRKPDSQLPWEFLLGHAAHRLIAYI